MRNRSRLLMLLVPWWAGTARDALGQANTNVPGGGPGGEVGEVQVGAGTQGDVTTGSSGSKLKGQPGSGTASGKHRDAIKAQASDRSAAGGSGRGDGNASSGQNAVEQRTGRPPTTGDDAAAPRPSNAKAAR